LNQNNQIEGLFATAILSRIRALDYLRRSELIESVCVKRIPTKSVPEYLCSEISPKYPKHYSKSDFTNNQRLIESAMLDAQRWHNRGILVNSSTESQMFRTCAEISPVIFTFGALDTLSNLTAMIMNSRKSRSIGSNTPWLKKTVELTRYAIRNQWTMISSYGSISHLMVAWLARFSGLVIVCDSPLPFMIDGIRKDQFLMEFSDILRIEKTLFVSSFTPGRIPDIRQRWRLRDHLAASLSDILIPCEIRPAGNMSEILRVAEVSKKIVVKNIPGHEQEVSLAKKSTETTTMGAVARQSDVVPKQNKFYPLSVSGSARPKEILLTHYTRACPGPWPGQTWSDYLKSLEYGDPGCSHTAFDTLGRIIQEKRIRSSSKWVRGDVPVVCLTEQEPEQFHQICKWRRGLMRTTFEPYGIAFSRDYLLSKGARKVTYIGEDGFRSLQEESRVFFQLFSCSSLNWFEEKEWRIVNDLDFSTIDPSDWYIIVPDEEDARNLVNQIGSDEIRVFVTHYGPEKGRIP
jgi:hypothetical protein